MSSDSPRAFPIPRASTPVLNFGVPDSMEEDDLLNEFRILLVQEEHVQEGVTENEDFYQYLLQIHREIRAEEEKEIITLATGVAPEKQLPTEEQDKEKKTTDLCYICMDWEPVTGFECHPTGLCIMCAQNILINGMNCPLCRKRVFAFAN
jgi:hypothetical protein